MPSNTTPRPESAIPREPAVAHYDVFVSHSSKDKGAAHAVCAALEASGLSCWIAPRNIDPGRKWDESILDGIAASRVVLLVHSANANASDDVEREIVHASNADLPVLPVRLEEVPCSKALRYHLVQSQWLDAFPPPVEAHLARVVAAVHDLVHAPVETSGAHVVPGTRPTDVVLLRDLVALGPLVALDVLVGVWVALNAAGAIEWVATNAVIAGVIALVWKLLPSQTTERARQDVARLLTSKKLALALSVVCVAFVVLTGFVSTVRVTSADPTPGAPGGSRLPVTAYVRHAVATGTSDASTIVDSVRLSAWGEQRSALLGITPLGRRVWLAVSPRQRTREVRAVPWWPRRFTYPADFEGPPTLALLPLGSLVFDVARRPRVVVDAERASGFGRVAEDTLRSMGAIILSAAPMLPVDSATRMRWLDGAKARSDGEPAIANQNVQNWMKARWVQPRGPLALGDKLRVLVIAGVDTLVRDTLTLNSSTADVYLRRP